MSRATRERRLEAEKCWPNLRQFLSGYFCQNRLQEFGTIEAALDRALGDWPIEGRQTLAREWWDWNSRRGWQGDLQSVLSDGLGVDLVFDGAEAARKFMNRVYERLVESVRREAGKDWVA